MCSVLTHALARRSQTARWAFGGSCKAPVINLSSGQSQLMVYGAAQCAVIYDYGNNTQRILQGHVSGGMSGVVCRRHVMCQTSGAPDDQVDGNAARHRE